MSALSWCGRSHTSLDAHCAPPSKPLSVPQPGIWNALPRLCWGGIQKTAQGGCARNGVEGTFALNIHLKGHFDAIKGLGLEIGQAGRAVSIPFPKFVFHAAWELETKKWKLYNGKRKLETGNRKAETGDCTVAQADEIHDGISILLMHIFHYHASSVLRLMIANS